MIRGMKKGGQKNWGLYILRCGDDSLYTGIAKNTNKRVRQHNLGKGAAYTRTRLPVRLVYEETKLTHSQALVREIRIKRLPRSAKEKLTVRK